MKTAALWDIRLRTPRLELRLPTDDELDAFYRVAAAGIHPPDEMPFAIAWTDTLNEADFKAFHRGTWERWTPESWTCNFVTFLDGQPIGSQTIEAAEFASKKAVGTGSWLGQAYQRRGYGTEQRAAVLEFAFAGLGAEAAISGALFPNLPSQRISEKLGYRVTGVSEVSPRAEPIQHYDYRLDRADWRCPIDVGIEALEPALPLFGAA
ncbi:MAG: GNAT family N-acetyltransferase [Actinobacteria bacterium]|nr:MAG: GNAT family N-acetyltransferase [Actinomycetota bacterium]